MGFAHRIVLTNAFDDRSRTALEVEGQFSGSALTLCNTMWPRCRFSYQNIIHEAVQSSFNVGTGCGIEICRRRSSEKLISER